MASETNPPRTVLVYSHSWLPGQVDGVAIRMMAHVKELVKRGSKVVVATPDFHLGPGKPEPQQFIPGVSEHVLLKTALMPVYKKNMCLAFSMSNFWALVQTIHRVKPDVVHGTQEASMQVLAAACTVCGVPLVVSVHTDVVAIANRDSGFSHFNGIAGQLHTQLALMFVHWGYRNWALSGLTYLCVSNQSKRLLADAGVKETNIAPKVWGPMADRETFSIDLPSDKVLEERKRLSFDIPDAYLLVYCGRITEEKDIQFLVDGLARAPKNVVLALIGNGSMAEDLVKLHGRESRLHCTGVFASREHVALSMRAADCCVSASTMETIGFTAMEALSCGTPMLAANAQGFKEHLDHGTNARLWEPLQTDSFDAELKEIMQTKGKKGWSREELRETMAWASVSLCTENALDAYSLASTPKNKCFPFTVTIGYFLANWVVTAVMMMIS